MEGRADCVNRAESGCKARYSCLGSISYVKRKGDTLKRKTITKRSLTERRIEGAWGNGGDVAQCAMDEGEGATHGDETLAAAPMSHRACVCVCDGPTDGPVECVQSRAVQTLQSGKS